MAHSGHVFMLLLTKKPFIVFDVDFEVVGNRPLLQLPCCVPCKALNVLAVSLQTKHLSQKHFGF